MKDHVLCAIDFSESSVQALKWAYRIAKERKASLIVLYSYRLLQSGKLNDIVSFRRKTEEESKKKFSDIERIVFSDQVPTSFITEIGFYSDTIENFVRKNPMTLVVLCESMASSIYEHKGQSLEHFLRALHVPLLIVPDKIDEGKDATVEDTFKGRIAS